MILRALQLRTTVKIKLIDILKQLIYFIHIKMKNNYTHPINLLHESLISLIIITHGDAEG